jgi:hypothetical protein
MYWQLALPLHHDVLTHLAQGVCVCVCVPKVCVCVAAGLLDDPTLDGLRLSEPKDLEATAHALGNAPPAAVVQGAVEEQLVSHNSSLVMVGAW